MKVKDIKFGDLVTDICFHPNRDVVAAGCIDGEISIHTYDYDEGTTRQLMTFSHHKEACRCINFSQDGNHMHTTSRDKSLRTFDLNTGALMHMQLKAHSSPIYSMCICGEHFLATGDDDGCLKLWDLRTHRSVMEEKHNDDYISDIAVDGECKTLAVTSGDGTLTAYSLKKRTMLMQSETFNTELLSVCLMKKNAKVVCGTGDKALNIFNWGEWNDISDRFPGFKGSVDSIVAINSDILCAASSDGNIRVVNILPNRFLGVIGRHEGFPVEKLTLSRDKKLVASCSHDHVVKFWDISTVNNRDVDATKKQDKRQKSVNLNAKKEDDFFFDLKNSEETGEERNAEESGDKISGDDDNNNDSDDDDDDGNDDSDDDDSGNGDNDADESVSANNEDENAGMGGA